MKSEKVKIWPFFVIPAKAGIQIFFCLVPGFCRDDVWTPAGVYPALDARPG
jgi:hypothetical protein